MLATRPVVSAIISRLSRTRRTKTMTDPESVSAGMPTRRSCTAMQPTRSRRRAFIPAHDSTQTSKPHYTCECYTRRRTAIRGDIGAYGGSERCTVHDAPLSEVVG
jgi:hypothetical protein